MEGKRRSVKRDSITQKEETLRKELEDMDENNKNYLYYFDCLDGVIGEQYFTASEINKLMTGKAEPMRERSIIRTAANYEAELIRYEVNEAGEPINPVELYDPWGFDI